MTPPRSSEIYVTPRTQRALKAIAEAQDITADALADLWLTQILEEEFTALMATLDQVDIEWQAFVKAQKKRLAEAVEQGKAV